MAGIDRTTGAVIEGWPHVVQSIGVIFTTWFGERTMRNWFGSDVPPLLGRNLVPSTVVAFFSAIVTAIELWEPRVRVKQIVPSGTPEAMRQGGLKLRIICEYRPRGHLGDPTPAGGDFSLTFTPATISVAAN